MQKVVLDVDPGIDDALSLVLALKSPEIEILGITTVAGNAPLEMTTENALRILDYLGAKDIPVAAGAKNPLKRSLEGALNYHGSDGLGTRGLAPLQSCLSTGLRPGTFLPAWSTVFVVRLRL